MINRYRYFKHILFLTGLFFTYNVKFASQLPISKSAKSTNDGYNFELYNKLQETIWVRLKYYNGDNIFLATEIQPMGKIRAVFSYTKNNEPIKLDLAIWNQSKDKKSKPIIHKWITPCGGQQPCKQTIYLSLKNISGNYEIRPQTGTYLGLSGKTDSGLSMKNNIKNLITNRNIGNISIKD